MVRPPGHAVKLRKPCEVNATLIAVSEGLVGCRMRRGAISHACGSALMAVIPAQWPRGGVSHFRQASVDIQRAVSPDSICCARL